MSSAQIVSATTLQPAPSSGTGRSVLPPVLYPHMSPALGMHYPAYSSSGAGQSLQVMSDVHGVALCSARALCGECGLYGVILG